jgi:hypothetical protein
MPKSINKGLVAVSTAMVASALLLMTPMLAAAQNPHFVKGPTLSENTRDLSLTVSFKAAGLGNEPINIFLTSSGGSADLQCVNKGGNEPAPKQFEFGPLQGDTITVTPRNGQITASPTLEPPDLPSGRDAGCPNNNWTVRPNSITYENVELHIEQNGQDILGSPIDFGDVTIP